MAIHESSVNFQNLIRDLAEMYPFDIADVVVVELVANSLDAKAARISIEYSPEKRILAVQDNGKGMNSVQFDEYHDFAAGLKRRGTGIGFAGLGAKVGFNVAGRVLTETRSKSLSHGSNWHFSSNKKLIWEDVAPIHLKDTGTRVEVYFREDLKPSYKSSEDLVCLLRRHYLPLLDAKFLDLYESIRLYSKDFRFVVNGSEATPGRLEEDLFLERVKEFFLTRKNKNYGYGIFGIARSEYPIAPDICGVMICTYGKVIKTDLFNQFPGSLGPRLFGIVEIPELVNYLTTSKTDFTHKGKAREFENIYGPIRYEFKNWLSSIGIESAEVVGSDEAMELERELKKLSEDLPELGEFLGFRTKKDVFKKLDDGMISVSTQEGSEITFPDGEGERKGLDGLFDVGDEPSQASQTDKEGVDKAQPISRKARRGPRIAFVDAPNRIDLAWVEGNSVFINTGHSSYIKCRPNPKLRRLHSLFAVANAIQRFLGAGSEKPDFGFIDRMMTSWGQK